MSNIIKQISARAKQIRKKHPLMKWTNAIKQASRELKGSSKPGSTRKIGGTAAKKKAAKKKPVKKVSYRQTGTATRKADQKRKAKAPGKRISKKGRVYYERRKNRSDKPGGLSGTPKTNAGAYQQMILGRMWSNTKNIEAVTMEIERMRNLSKSTKDKVRKKQIATAVHDRKKYLTSLKADNRMLKRILK